MALAEPILYGIFRALLDRNVPIGVPDYLDALRALRHGFGGPRDVSDETRHSNLCWLCEVLWARNKAEIRLIRDLFAAIEPTTAAEVAAFEKWLGFTRPKPQPLTQEQPPSGPPGGASAPSAGVSGDSGSSLREMETPLGVEVEAPTLHDGWRLPPQAARFSASETFVLEPETVLSTRDLAVAWRRLRSLFRTGAKVDLDINATIVRRCREGVLSRPVLRAQRVNRSSLLVLADRSTSMAPWLPLVDLVERSLPLGRLQNAQVLYFSNVPHRSVFVDRALLAPMPLDQLFRLAVGSGLIVLSDAGFCSLAYSRSPPCPLSFILAQARLTRAGTTFPKRRPLSHPAPVHLC